MKNSNFDIYQEVTDRIIAQLEKGVIPWRKPWKVSGIAIKGATDITRLAFNRITKTAYSPLNQMLLSHVGEYASFKQWQELGGTIRKGAKAEIVVFWKWLDVTKTEKSENENEPDKVIRARIPYLHYYQVFHISDVIGVKPLDFKNVKPEDVTENEFDVSEQAENIIQEYASRENLKIMFEGNEAYYSPMLDYVKIPERFKFGKNTAEYYSTIFHELTHSTGAKHRLDRLSRTAYFGSTDYSKEELVAEIGASGMLFLLNVETESSFKNSTAYIQSWLEQLRNDKKLIVHASSQAEKAIRYIFNGKEQNEIQGAV